MPPRTRSQKNLTSPSGNKRTPKATYYTPPKMEAEETYYTPPKMEAEAEEEITRGNWGKIITLGSQGKVKSDAPKKVIKTSGNTHKHFQAPYKGVSSSGASTEDATSFGYGQALIKQKHPKVIVKKKVPLYILKR